MCENAWDEIKKPFYKVAQRDSQNLKHLGEDWNWQWLENEAKKNEKNPGRAIGKAAANAAAWWLTSGASAGAEAGALAAGEIGGQAAMTAAEQAALELAKQEALNSAQYAMQQGLLSGASQSFGSGLLGGQGGVGMGSAFSMAPGPGVVAPGQQLGAMADTAAINAGFPKAAPGYWAPKGSKEFAMKQGLGMMGQDQTPPAPPPPRRQEQPPVPPAPYGGSGLPGGLLGLSEEEKQRLRMMGYPV